MIKFIAAGIIGFVRNIFVMIESTVLWTRIRLMKLISHAPQHQHQQQHQQPSDIHSVEMTEEFITVFYKDIN